MEYRKKTGTYPRFEPPVGVILCYQKNLMEHVLKNHKTVKAEGFYGDMHMLTETGNKVGIVGNFGIGAPAAATLLEELIAFGVKRFISIGTAGSLRKDLRPGDLMVCEKALRDEGTSHHYLKPSRYAFPSERMSKKIAEALERLGQDYFAGKSWTTDAPYRETIAEVQRYQKEWISAVDMEAAALFAVAEYRKVDVAVIFTISDTLADLKWKPRFHAKRTRKGLEVIYKVALSALLHD
jgi:uridine phosphorylase